ncbi:AsmA family protein [Zunongwangia profunda]|uniref:AsmA family protein n=1 Tax=Zunongwangia profunda TaxID=398743 RepID=UPI0023A8CB71|nr:AsmA family protein [Zunongwangia profunda]|tara:strand:+ start:2085 stop:4784 length:2700 start_codon:yes stop_codon:yes gene_type:complete
MKKVFKIIGITLLVIIVLLIAAPFLFSSQIENFVKKTINNNVNAKVEFADIDLSLFRSFPQATVVLSDVSVINNAPFEGDTLADVKEVTLQMSIKELFKGSEEPKRIDEFKVNDAYINILVDSLGRANYDIAKIDTTATTTGTPADTTGGFSLDLQHYEINNSRLHYKDVGAKMALKLEELNHQGTGDFSLDQTELDTDTEAIVSFEFDSINYLNKNKVDLDAVIQMDLENMKYTFLENEAHINQLPLTFNGFVQVDGDDTNIDLTFKTPSSDFKNFLAVIPEVYAKNIENVETKGDFVVDGMIKGTANDKYIPKLDIKVTSNNASFKYPDLPKSVQDINLDLRVLNETGIVEDTYLTFKNVKFRIDQDRFAANGSVKNLMGNMLVALNLDGTLNLANLDKAYPLDMDLDLNGILTVDASTSFDMNSIEKEQYQNVKSSGTAGIKNFSYKSPEIPNEIKVSSAKVNLSQGNVTVPELDLTTGQTDLKATGTIQNLMGFLFTDQELKGIFNVKSNTFAVNDFMVAQTEEKPVTTSEENTSETSKTEKVATGEEAIKIPSFLDVVLTFNANKVLYDNLKLTNAKGKLIIRDETATLENITTDIFNGNIALNGHVSTKTATPTFDMSLDLNAISIAESFNGLELMQGLAPIANALQGKIQTNLNLKGNLNNDLTPILTSLAGDALAQILTADVNPEKMPLLAKLDSQLNFIDLDKVDLNNLKTKLSFKDGAVNIQPFDFKIKDVLVQVSGSHGFNMNMNYKLNLDVPAKYLGNQIGNTLSQLSGSNLQNTKVEIPVGLSGTFQSPQINLNMQQAISSLTQKIVEEQKNNLKEKGTNALNDLINKQLGKNNQNQQSTDSTATKTPQTKTDSTKTTQEKKIEDAAKSILGGLLNKNKKKKDTAQ